MYHAIIKVIIDQRGFPLHQACVGCNMSNGSLSEEPGTLHIFCFSKWPNHELRPRDLVQQTHDQTRRGKLHVCLLNLILLHKFYNKPLGMR